MGMNNMDDEKSVLHGEGFAAALITCATVLDVCMDERGMLFMIAVIVAFGWMTWVNAQ